MNRMVKRLMVVLMSVLMVLGTVTTPVQAKSGSSNTNGWGSWWGWWWPVQPTNPEPDPEPEPTEEPVVEEEEPVVTEEPIVEQEPVVTEEPVIDEDPVVEEEPAIEEETPAEVSFPERTFDPVTVEGTTVNVYAPEGALPEGTTMEVVPVSLDAVQTAVDNAEEITGTVVVAFDITFRTAEGEVFEPNIPLTVTMTSEEIKNVENPQVVHVDTTAEEIEATETDVEAEAVEADVDENAVTFEAENFSIYAVVEPGQGGAEARAAVNFWGYEKDASTGEYESVIVATYYIKNRDDLLAGGERDTTISYLDDIVSDPGAGTLGEEVLFKGWSVDDLMRPSDPAGAKPYAEDPGSYSIVAAEDQYAGADYTTDTPALTVEGVREYLYSEITSKDLIKEGDVINVYAIVLKYYDVTYFADTVDGLPNWNVSLGSDTVLLRLDETTVEYTVNMPYSSTDNQNFKGWVPTHEEVSLDDGRKYPATAGNISPALDVYPNNTHVTLSGNIVFNVDAPHGNWLIYNTNGKGGTFNAPQFYLPAETTSPAENAIPEKMTRNGYHFGGWYTDEACTDGNEFEFGGTLDENTNIYAKWIENDTAKYTVILHTQNINRDGYDMAGSYIGTGAVHSYIPYTFVDNGDEDYVTGVGENNGHYTGFCLTEASKNQQIEINAEGTAVLNLYYDRIEYEFRFYYYRERTGNNPYSAAQYSAAYQGNGVYGVAQWYGWGNNRPTQTYGPDQTATVEGYTAHYFVLKAYYGQDISSLWPSYDQLGNYGNYAAISFVMMNGTGLKKEVQGQEENGYGTGHGSDTIKGLITIMDEMILGKTNDADGNFVVIRYSTRNDWNYHIFYEQVEGEDYTGKTTYTFNGVNYYEDHVVVSRSTNTNVAEQNPPQYSGYVEVGESNQNGQYGGNNGNNARWQTGGGGNVVNHVRYYYNRLLYPVTYMDGVYVTGNSEAGTVDHSRATQLITTSEKIEFGAPIPANVQNYVPALPDGEEGYVFEGWYFDEACTKKYTFTTMPIGGITVYAKWRQVRYRVFLHPNADLDSSGTPDLTLSWGDESASAADKQQMGFSVAWGDKISLPFGTRTGYEFIGWFKQDGSLYMAGTELNDATVPAEPAYDKETDMTDVIDKFGHVVANGDEYWISNEKFTNTTDPYNSDAGRDWVTRKLDLYGKWRKIIAGSDGIRVHYVEGEHGDATTLPTDPLYYKDEAGAIAQAACTVKEADAAEYQFLYWVVQTYNTETAEYEDLLDAAGEPVICYPGDSFTVKLDYAKADIHETTINPNTGETVILDADYTMQLRAEYGPSHTPEDTHFNFYRNWSAEDATVPGEALLHTDEGLQINEAVDIYTLDPNNGIPVRDGYVFLGWARDVEKESADGEPIYFHDYSGKEKDSLYIKWVEEVPATETEEAIPGHYEAKDGDGNWVTVTQVAADEKLPYQAYYAVWDQAFYVYHSSDGTVDKVGISTVDSKKGYDLFSTVKDNYLYGGYFKGYYNVTNEAAMKAGDEGTAVENFVEYDGSKLYDRVDGKLTRFWTKTGATGAFTNVVDETYGGGVGTAMTPKAGMVYYLREIKKDFLDLHVQVVYDWSNNNVIDYLYLVTTVDNNIYDQAGFEVTIQDPENNKATLYASFSIQSRGSTKVSTIKANAINGIGGYVGVWDSTSKLITGQSDGTQFTVKPYWLTLDGVRVEDDYHGERTFNIGDKTFGNASGSMYEVTNP